MLRQAQHNMCVFHVCHTQIYAYKTTLNLIRSKHDYTSAQPYHTRRRQKTYVQVGHAYRIPLLIGDQIQGLIPSILPVS